MKKLTEDDVINVFVAFLRENGHSVLRVDRWPDKENRDSSDIDAIAGPFAIEHTSVDTLPNQRRDADWFMRAAGGVEQELPSNLRFRLGITLEYRAVTKGQDWAAVRMALKKWIHMGAQKLTDGRHVIEDIPGVPFRLYVTKKSDRPAGVFVSRFDPGDDTLPDRIREQFDRKAEKLAKYPDDTKILLVENDDFALMNEFKILDAIRQAYPNGFPIGIDQVWYADTSIPEEVEFSNFTRIFDKKEAQAKCTDSD